jgi:fructose-1,6-bisphosphatase II
VTNPCLCQSYARVTERAALAGARWLGRADQAAAEEAAVSGAEEAVSQLPISGRVVIGVPEGDPRLAVGSIVGAGGEEVDLALDPMEGGAVVARGGNNAISMIVAGPPGSLPSLPDMYMRKMAVGPVAAGSRSTARSATTSARSPRRSAG